MQLVCEFLTKNKTSKSRVSFLIDFKNQFKISNIIGQQKVENTLVDFLFCKPWSVKSIVGLKGEGYELCHPYNIYTSGYNKELKLSSRIGAYFSVYLDVKVQIK